LRTPAIELMRRHHSVRHYKPDPVSADMIETIVSAAQCSSTSQNLQTWSAIAVTDASTRLRLATLCGDQEHVAQAPSFLAWCADLSRLDRTCQLRGYTQVTEYVDSFLGAAMDCAIAAQTGALAAESLGLGICYIGSIRNQPQQVIDLLGLPRLVFPITGMTLGWPAAAPAVKPRLPLNAVLHWETYDRRHEDQALSDYDREMRQTGIYQGRQVPVSGKPEETEDYGWLEHCARRVSQPARTELREILRRQVFELE